MNRRVKINLAYGPSRPSRHSRPLLVGWKGQHQQLSFSGKCKINFIRILQKTSSKKLLSIISILMLLLFLCAFMCVEEPCRESGVGGEINYKITSDDFFLDGKSIESVKWKMKNEKQNTNSVQGSCFPVVLVDEKIFFAKKKYYEEKMFISHWITTVCCLQHRSKFSDDKNFRKMQKHLRANYTAVDNVTSSSSGLSRHLNDIFKWLSRVWENEKTNTFKKRKLSRKSNSICPHLFESFNDDMKAGAKLYSSFVAIIQEVDATNKSEKPDQKTFDFQKKSFSSKESSSIVDLAQSNLDCFKKRKLWNNLKESCFLHIYCNFSVPFNQSLAEQSHKKKIHYKKSKSLYKIKQNTSQRLKNHCMCLKYLDYKDNLNSRMKRKGEYGSKEEESLAVLLNIISARRDKMIKSLRDTKYHKILFKLKCEVETRRGANEMNEYKDNNEATIVNFIVYTNQQGPENSQRFKCSKRRSRPIQMASIDSMETSGPLSSVKNFDHRKQTSKNTGFKSTQKSTIIHKRKKRKIGTRVVEVVSGSAATLPCDLSVQKSENSVQLVLWIKEGMHTPLYSYDYRELLEGLPKEMKPNANSSLARRTSFRTDVIPAALLIERVEREDAGIYRCRVDFLLTPTRNTRVLLTVIVPPSRIKMTWKQKTSGGAISSQTSPPTNEGVVGPFREGERPVLICSNDDGIPLPSVKWYDGDRIIDDSFSIDPEAQVATNTLELPALTRKDSGRRLTCQAANVNTTQPATATVTLGMILKILSVHLEIPRQLKSDMASDIQCLVRGSMPAPSISWWLGNKKIIVPVPQVLEDGNLTLSVFRFIPSPEDDGAMLICQAINTKIVDDVVQDSKLLSINFVPQVTVQLGRSLEPLRIKEGDDVYFECSVKSKPEAFKIEWKHNNISLEDGEGVFVSNMSLVVQSVKRANGGNYTCHAFNAVGVGVSLPLNLDVKYAPVCANINKTQHSVAKLENAEILCKVHANPPKVTFRWTFNNTAEAIDVPDGRFVVTGTESRVNYTPMNELDYGTLLCWANNSIGIQTQPCVFQIVAAGKPDPPHNCRVVDVTISSLQVTCLAGDDGGLTQQFILQVYKIGSTSPIMELTKTTPSFSVTNLRPATAYKILVVALNDKGASRPTERKAYTVRVPETQEETSAEPTRDREREVVTVPLAVIIGSSVAAVPIILIIAFVIWFRTCRSNKRSLRSPSSSNRDIEERSFGYRRRPRPSSHSAQSVISCKESSLARSSLELPISTDSSNADDYNPDLISHPAADLSENFKNLQGNMSAISNASSVFFLSSSSSSFIPTKCTGAVAVPVTDYMHIVGSDESRSSSDMLQPGGIISHQPSSSSSMLPLNFVAPLHVPYSSMRDGANKASQPEGVQQILEVPLPPPAFYNQD